MATAGIDIEEQLEALLLPIGVEEEALPRLPWCPRCGTPVFDDELMAYDAWDRGVHSECLAAVPRIERVPAGLDSLPPPASP